MICVAGQGSRQMLTALADETLQGREEGEILRHLVAG